MRNWILRITLALTLLALWSAAAAADELAESGAHRRVLGDHQFQPSARVGDPFVTTHVYTNTGAGFATGFESPFFDVDGDTLGSLKGDLAFFGLRFEYQKNLFGWGAFRVTVNGSGRVGVDEQSVLADGLNTVYGMEFEGKGRVFQRQNSQVAVHFTLSRKNIFGLNPFEFAQTIVDSGLTKDNSLVSEGDILRLGVGAAGAYALNPWLGFQVAATIGPAKPFDADADTEVFFRGGVVVDFDLRPPKNVPIGFLVGYDYDSFPEGGADVAKGISSATFAINYTGRRQFHIGAETVVSRLDQRQADSHFAAIAFGLNIRYFF